MTPLQLELTRLIGKKELTFGCFVRHGRNYIRRIGDGLLINGYWNEGTSNLFIDEIIGHPATLSDFHRFLNEKDFAWCQYIDTICTGKYLLNTDKEKYEIIIPYDSSLGLLEQSEDTLKNIIEIIKENK